MKLLCIFGHKWAIKKRFEIEGYATVYGRKCERCGELRCDYGGFMPRFPRSLGDKPQTAYAAREWMEQESGKLLAWPVVWLR